MKVHYLQHVSFEDTAGIGAWLTDRGHTLAGTHVYRDEPLPDVADYDGLVIMGGPMSLHADQQKYPWILHERDHVRAAIDAGRRVLGVCLGAQFIAMALEASVHAGQAEVGWFDVEKLPGDADATGLGEALPSRFMAFHWHGDTFDLPDGAAHLGRSQRCTHQAFSWGEHVLALQFHLESTSESITKLMDHCPQDLPDVPEPGRMTRTQIEQTMDAHLSELTPSFEKIMRWFTGV